MIDRNWKLPRSLALEILEKEAALREAGALTPPAIWRSDYLRQLYYLSKGVKGA